MRTVPVMWVRHDLVGQAGRFRAEQQHIAGLIRDVGVPTTRVRERGTPARAAACPRPWPDRVHGDIGHLVIVQTRPLDLGVGHGETERLDQMQLAAGVAANRIALPVLGGMRG